MLLEIKFPQTDDALPLKQKQDSTCQIQPYYELL